MSNVEYKSQEDYQYENAQEQLYPGESHGTKGIFKIFIWLTIITVFDIILYFVSTDIIPQGVKNVAFIGLGIVKAILIVGHFMHLKNERMALILTIVVPMVFVIFFIVWLLYEGTFWSSFNV